LLAQHERPASGAARSASLQSRRVETEQLRNFVEVVRQGSFAAAARTLQLAPSIVTRAVAALEHQLGVRLMQRSTRKLSLTDAGAAYYEHVCGVLAALEQAADEARATTGELRGTVRLTASVSYGQMVMVPLLPRLHQLHPGLEVELLLTDAIVDLHTERIDAALRLGPAVDSSLIGQRLAPVRFRVCASPGYLKAHGRPRTPADLANCDCLRFSLPGFRTQWKFRAAADAPVQTVDVKGWLVLSTGLALHRAALDGLGPVLLSSWLVDADCAAGRLVDLFPDLEATATNFDSAVWLLYPSRAYLPRRVRAVIDFLKTKISAG
jgi:DNA-binding transcriptional LysR family regulator